ncbi:MAG: metallophosphoesterase [Rubrivivax sp.]|nr:MAG: metallophosphoesterase [Rubrivivax sp.]
MPLYLLTFVLHGYVAWRLLPALAHPVWVQLALAAVLLSSALITPWGLMSRRLGPSAWSDAVAWVGLFFLGLFSSLAVLTIFRDVVLLVGLAAQALGLYAGPIAELATWSAQVVVLLASGATLWGLFNARRRAAIVPVDVPIAGLPPALHGFTIAQISDIHVGPTIKAPYLNAIVQAVNGLKADMVAVTGDLVDGSVQDLAPHVAPLARLSSRHGTYFVTGNHEYYAGAHAWLNELRRLGLTVLMNEHVVLRHGTSNQAADLVLAGVADYGAHHFDPAHRSDPQSALAGAPASAAVKILLAHQPRTAPAAADAGFDLQLSGHTHGGQFWPWNLFVPLQQPFTAGLHRWQKMWVYTSRGTGYWGPPKRFGAPSEITRLRLVPSPN